MLCFIYRVKLHLNSVTGASGCPTECCCSNCTWYHFKADSMYRCGEMVAHATFSPSMG